MQIDRETYNWLVQLQVFSPLESPKFEHDSIRLPSQWTSSLQNATAFVKVLRTKFGANRALVEGLSSLKPQNSQGAKTYNWNLVWIALKSLKLQFQQEFKSLVMSGDSQFIVEVLNSIRNLSDSQQPYLRDKRDEERRKKALQPFDASKLQSKRQLSQTNNTLQFLILGLSKNLSLPIKEIVGLFTNQNKYLAHLFAKGFKGQFVLLCKFYSQIMENVTHLVKIFSFDESGKSVLLTLQALKPAFFSKSVQLARIACQTFVQISNQMKKYPQIPKEIRKDFMVGQSKGLLTLILGTHRHPILGSQYAQILHQYCSFNYKRVIQSDIRQQVQSLVQFYSVMSSLLPPLMQFQDLKQKISKQVIQNWLTIVKKSLDISQDKSSERYWAFSFLCQIWYAFPEFFAQQRQILDVLKLGWHYKSYVQFTNCITALFQIVFKFAQIKSVQAVSAYSLICFVFQSLIKEEDKRVFLMLNLIPTFAQYPQMPIDSTITSFSAALNTGITMQTIDLLFVQAVSKLKKLSLKSGVELVQSLTKNFVDNVVFGLMLQQSIVRIVQRFNDQKDMIQTIIKISKYMLAFIYSGDKAKKPRQANLPVYNGKKPSQKKLPVVQLQTQIISAQKRGRMVQLLKKLIMLGGDEKNSRLRQLIAQTNLQLKNYHKSLHGHKGLYMLLNHLGSAKQIMNQSQRKQRQSRLKQMGIDSQKAESVQGREMSLKGSIVGNVSNINQDLIQIKQNIEKKQALKLQEQRMKLQQSQRKKQKIAKDLVNRQIIIGYGRTKDNQVNLIRELGVWQKQLSKTRNSQAQIYDTDLLEDRDIQHIQNVQRKYHRAVKVLFHKYANSGFSIHNKASAATSVFQHILQRSQVMSSAQCNLFAKDLDLLREMTKQQNISLMRNFNIKILKMRDSQELDFYGFQKYLVQLAIFIAAKPHMAQLHVLPFGQILQNFYQRMRQSLSNKGENTTLFDNPDTAYFNQSDLIAQFNRRLQQDPNYNLPQSYRKVYQKEIKNVFRIKDNLNLEETYVFCLQIIDQVVASTVGTHILQSFIIKNTTVKAKPGIMAKPQSRILQKTIIQKKQYKKPLSTDKPRRKVIQVPQKINLTLGMKLGISYVGVKYKHIAQQVAGVLDQVIKAVEKQGNQKKKVKNQAERMRKEQDQQQMRRNTQRIKKLKERKEELQKLKRQREEKKRKQQQQNQQKNQKQARQKQAKEKAKKEIQQKHKSDVKTLVEDKKKKQQQQKRKEQEQQKQRKKKNFQERKKNFDQFNNKQIKLFGEKLQKQKKDKEDRKKDQEQKRTKDQQLKAKLKQKISKQSEKVKRGQQDINKTLNDIFETQATKRLLQDFKDKLSFLWEFLIKYSFKGVTGKTHKIQVPKQVFKLFSNHFRISPHIVHSKEVMFVFNSLTKDKIVQSGTVLGLDESQFIRALLRISAKGKPIFNQFAKIIATREMGEKQANQIIKKQGEENQFGDQKELQPEKDKDDGRVLDNYGDLTKVTAQTLKGLLYYLRIPAEKLEAFKYFNKLMQTNQSKVVNHKNLRQKFNQDVDQLIKKKQVKEQDRPQ